MCKQASRNTQVPTSTVLPFLNLPARDCVRSTCKEGYLEFTQIRSDSNEGARRARRARREIRIFESGGKCGRCTRWSRSPLRSTWGTPGPSSGLAPSILTPRTAFNRPTTEQRPTTESTDPMRSAPSRRAQKPDARGLPLNALAFDTENCPRCDTLYIPSHPSGTLTEFSSGRSIVHLTMSGSAR